LERKKTNNKDREGHRISFFGKFNFLGTLDS